MYKFKAETRGATFRGKYCTRCNTVFEELPLGLELRHKGFPSFGLERQDCAECVATDPGDTPSTLLDKVTV